MRVVGKDKLAGIKRHGKAATTQVAALLKVVEPATWKMLADVRNTYPKASKVKSYVVFNVQGNSYRIATRIHYGNQIVLITHAGTHAEYDKWDLGE